MFMDRRILGDDVMQDLAGSARARPLSSMTDLLHALGRAEHFDILRTLTEGSLTCTELSERMELDHATVCKKLSVLRQFGFVEYRAKKKCHIYSLTERVGCTPDGSDVEIRFHLDGIGVLIIRTLAHDVRARPVPALNGNSQAGHPTLAELAGDARDSG